MTGLSDERRPGPLNPRGSAHSSNGTRGAALVTMNPTTCETLPAPALDSTAPMSTLGVLVSEVVLSDDASDDEDGRDLCTFSF